MVRTCQAALILQDKPLAGSMRAVAADLETALLNVVVSNSAVDVKAGEMHPGEDTYNPLFNQNTCITCRVCLLREVLADGPAPPDLGELALGNIWMPEWLAMPCCSGRSVSPTSTGNWRGVSASIKLGAGPRQC